MACECGGAIIDTPMPPPQIVAAALALAFTVSPPKAHGLQRFAAKQRGTHRYVVGYLPKPAFAQIVSS
jgi:hypothetical protein